MIEFLSVEVISAGASALAALGGGAAYAWRRRRAQKQLETKLKAEIGSWSEVLTKTEGDFGWINSDPLNLVLGNPQFTGGSKTGHEQARKLWANWTAQREVVADRLRKAEAIYEQYKALSSFSTSGYSVLEKAYNTLQVGDVSVSAAHLPVKLAPLAKVIGSQSLAVKDLPALVATTGSAAAAELKRFVDALNSAQVSTKEIERQLHADEPTSIRVLKNGLVRLGLPVEPYERRFEDIDTLAADLQRELARDPLSDQAEVIDRMTKRVDVLRRRLQRAVELHGACAQHRRTVAELKDRVAKMRAMKVAPSDLPELRVDRFYTLDEQGFAVDEHLNNCDRLVTYLDRLLHEASMMRFTRQQSELRAAMNEVERVMQQVLSDQAEVAKQLTLLAADSTALDSEADAPDRRAICDLYVAQRWNAASKAVSSLMVRHQQRKQAREDVNALLQATNDFARRLESYQSIASAQLDADTASLCAVAAQLVSEGRQGASDWAALVQRVRDTGLILSGPGETSLNSRLTQELALHKQATADARELEVRVKYLEGQISERWGGTRASDAFAAVRPALDEAVASAFRPKQDWIAVQAAIKDALALSQPVHEEVQAEIMRYSSMNASLKSLLEQVKRCKSETYTVSICDITYGAGLYCVVDEPEALAQQAAERLAERDYESAAAKLDAAAKSLYKLHLECWWLTLQMMASSDETCGRKYAQDQGYTDGKFQVWQQAKIRNASDLWYPPKVIYNVHVGKKPTIQFLRTREFDAPPVQDYEPSAVKAD
jgi:hypothetical protein